MNIYKFKKIRKILILGLLGLLVSMVFHMLPHEALAQISSPIPSPAQSDFLSTPPVEDKVSLDSLSSQNSPASANFRKPTRLRPFERKQLKADESATIVVDNAKTEDLEVKIFDSNGNAVSADIETVSESDPVVLKVHPPIQNKPGRYRVKITDSQNKSYIQDFMWGVLAINTNKSVYNPQETASIQMAVLDETGEMVCNSNMSLKITSPGLESSVLSTSDGTIIVNPQCYNKEFTLIPDYQAQYQVGGSGIYRMELSATTPEGSYTIIDSFEVSNSVAFDVERVSATRIYPPNIYPVTFTIKANQNFEGVVKEYVPASFNISKIESEGVKTFDSTETQTADSDKNVLGAEIFDNGKPFSGDFPQTLGFGGQHRDPGVGKKYTEFGVLGHDGVDFALPMRTPVIAVADGEIVRAGDGDYGVTIVIQHSWGKSYYGHLDKVIQTIGAKVKKGETIGLSGNTGLSSGPHLHFGIKPEKNDSDNGYYGKINPLSFMGLADSGAKHGMVAGVSTASEDQIQNGVKVINWKVSLKKGESIKLGYQFNAPLVSPELYLLGPLEFVRNGKTVFAEKRHWQIAADSVVVTGGGMVSSEAQFGGLQRKVVFVNSNWYAFYNNGTDVFYKKSSDGLSWGSPQNLDINEDNDADNYNPSVDVSGNFIHVFYVDDSADQVQGLRLDTTSDTTTQTSVCALTSPGAIDVSTYMVSVASLDAASAIVAYSDTNGGSGVDVFKVTALDGASCTVADVQPGNITFGSGITASDRPVLVGLSSTKVAMVSQDGDLSYAEFDVTENEWRKNNQTIASVADNIYSAVTDGAATPKIWVLSDAAADSTDTNFYTLDAANIDFAEQSVDAGAGGNDQDGHQDIDMFCVAADDCKMVYVDNMNTSTPDIIFRDCNNASCSSSTAVTIDSDCGTTNSQCNPKIHCSSATDCHIVYFEVATAPDIFFVDCDGADSTNACSTIAAVNTDADFGGGTSTTQLDIDCPTGDNCKFIYGDDDTDSVVFVDCANDECAVASDTLTPEIFDYGTSVVGPKIALDCPSATTCKVVGHDVDAGTVVLTDCSGAGTPETCASPPAPVVIQGSVGTTVGLVDVDIDCLADGTDCKIVYTDDANDDIYFVDCNDTDCNAPDSETVIDSNGGASSTVEPNVSLYCVSATDCKILYVGALTSDAEKLYFVDCDNAGCSTGSVVDTPGPRFRGSVHCAGTSTDCKMVYYEGTPSTVPAVIFADCDTTNCYPTVTDADDPWTTETNVKSVSLTYDSSNTNLIANVIKDATGKAYYKVSDTPITTYSESVLATSGLVGYWRLGEPSGTNANDESVTANDATYQATPTLGVAGALAGDSDTGVTFTAASSEYADAPSNAAYSPGTGDYSIEFWVKTTAAAVGFLVERGATDCDGIEAAFDGDSLTGRIGGCGIGVTSARVDDGLWHHAVLVMDRSGNGQWWVDGATSGAAVDISAESGTNVTGNNRALNIARRLTGNYFDGSMDEVAYYNVALSQATIEEHADIGINGPLGGAMTWGSEVAYDFRAGDLDNMSSPETAAGTAQMGVLLRQGMNIEFDLFASGSFGPTLTQTMRHGKWIKDGVEQPFTF